MTNRKLFISAIAVLLFTNFSFTTAAQQIDPAGFSGMQWRMIGPFRAGRVNAVTGVPGQPNTFYFGSVGGGVWKSKISGRFESTIFDNQNIDLIGAIAVALSSSESVCVGAG